MARAKNKTDLLENAETSFKKMNDMIENFTPEQQESNFPMPTMNRNIRDLLAHMYEWQIMLFDWYETGQRGEKPEIPAPNHNWRTTPLLNKEIHAKYESMSLKEAKKKLNDSHTRMIELIQSLTNDQLFLKNQVAWTKSTTLGAYFISATSSHYEWAMKIMRQYARLLKHQQK